MRNSMYTTSFARCFSSLNFSRAMFFRHFSDTGRGANTLPNLIKSVPYNYRPWATRLAREALTDYLHSTRGLPFTYAELISKNSTHCLYETMSRVPFSPLSFRKKFSMFLRYNPINEFGFFFESIGIEYGDVNGVLKPNVHFFSEDCVVLDAACYLAGYGFPWDKLGRLYLEEASIFGKEAEFLSERIDGLVSLGFDNQQIVGICLTFPCVLKGEGRGLSDENGALLDDLKRVFVDFDFGSYWERNADVWSEVCRKMKVFYDLGVAKGEVGKLLVKGRSILTDFSEEVLVKKVEFFSRLGSEKVEVGLLILSNPEILSIQLHDRVISVSSLLEHFGLCKNKLKFVEQNYKYAFGRNNMVNLPNILKAIDLHEWFFDRMKCGYHHLFANYDLTSPDDGVDEKYVQSMERIKSRRTYIYSSSKLEFFHGIGFGENGHTMKLLVDVHVSPSELQLRFDFLLNKGIKFPKLCKMIIRAPKILNQDIDSFTEKINYLEEIGFSLDYLEVFPAYLFYNLEKRIKPRYKFHMWLIEQGLCTKKYTLSSIIAVSHKVFLSQLSRIHPTAPQLWLERHGTKNPD
ncbi:transcription termination factor MTEF18, mitochondrial-like [Silene latifolia]|uniref:transcription termination factor MTEF18, mitochondrial-like n=1 Tax=Silene latifolia TaxID=37657 RepID=UPI003D778E8A